MAAARPPGRMGTLRWPSPRRQTSATARGRQCVWRGPLLLAAGPLGAYTTDLLCDKAPVWGFSLWVACMAWTSSPIWPCWQTSWSGPLVSQPPNLRHLECPETDESAAYLLPGSLPDWVLLTAFPLWSSKSLNAVGIISSFMPRIIRLGCAHYSAKVKISPYYSACHVHKRPK